MVIRDGKIKGGGRKFTRLSFPDCAKLTEQMFNVNFPESLSMGVWCVILPDLVYNLPDPPPGPYACVYRVYECLMIEEPRMMLLLCNLM